MRVLVFDVLLVRTLQVFLKPQLLSEALWGFLSQKQARFLVDRRLTFPMIPTTATCSEPTSCSCRCAASSRDAVSELAAGTWHGTPYGEGRG